jgi:hypothetical protein
MRDTILHNLDIITEYRLYLEQASSLAAEICTLHGTGNRGHCGINLPNTGPIAGSIPKLRHTEISRAFCNKPVPPPPALVSDRQVGFFNGHGLDTESTGR